MTSSITSDTMDIVRPSVVGGAQSRWRGRGGGLPARLARLGRLAATVALFTIAFPKEGLAQLRTGHLLAELPEDPGARSQVDQSNAGKQSSVLPASISGVALDTNGGVVAGAEVTLTGQNGPVSFKTTSGSDGSFIFSNLSPGVLSVTIQAQGLETYHSLDFSLQHGQTLELPAIALRLSETQASIDVTVTEEQVAAEQVHEQEKQRVLGVFPNFYTSYIWNAAPMNVRQKFRLALRAAVDPVNFLTVGGVAAVEQNRNIFPAYGNGVGGYGKRYAARYTDVFSSRLIGSALIPALLHQDPRYFYRGSGSTSSRLFYAMSSAVITRGDNGRRQPNYSRLLGNLAAGGISNLYRPTIDSGAALTLETAFVEAGVDAVGNVVREFLLRAHVPSVPQFAKGKN